MYRASKVAKTFGVTYAAKLSERQYKIFIKALTYLLIDAYNQGYSKGREAGRCVVPQVQQE
jgi:hypothetical protein